ncbi:MAG: PilZ domain-containing protein [Candidatus Acidiferrales bacterium]
MAEIKASVPGAPTESVAERRRTQRVLIAMPVLVRGGSGTKTFEEETSTVSVSANGCLVRLAHPVVRGEEIAVVNPKTAEELPSTVTFIGMKETGKSEVGVEFAEPSPLFWRIAFPPADWDASERKRPTGVRPPSKLPKPSR